MLPTYLNICFAASIITTKLFFIYWKRCEFNFLLNLLLITTLSLFRNLLPESVNGKNE